MLWFIRMKSSLVCPSLGCWFCLHVSSSELHVSDRSISIQLSFSSLGLQREREPHRTTETSSTTRIREEQPPTRLLGGSGERKEGASRDRDEI